MKVLEKNINVSKDIVDTYNKAHNEDYDLYACIGRNGRYGFNGKSHYELKSDNAVNYSGKLYAATPQYEITLAALSDNADTNEDVTDAAQDGENTTEMTENDFLEENLTDDISGDDGANNGEFEGDSEELSEDEIEEGYEDDLEEEIEEEDEISLEEENAELRLEIAKLRAEIDEYKPLAEKYLANKDLIDSVEQRIAEANEPFIEEVNTLKNRLDRIKAVVEEA